MVWGGKGGFGGEVDCTQLVGWVSKRIYVYNIPGVALGEQLVHW